MKIGLTVPKISNLRNHLSNFHFSKVKWLRIQPEWQWTLQIANYRILRLFRRWLYIYIWISFHAAVKANHWLSPHQNLSSEVQKSWIWRKKEEFFFQRRAKEGYLSQKLFLEEWTLPRKSEFRSLHTWNSESYWLVYQHPRIMSKKSERYLVQNWRYPYICLISVRKYPTNRLTDIQEIKKYFELVYQNPRIVKKI